MSFLRESSIVFLYRLGLVGVAFATDVALARFLGPSGKGYVAILTITPVMLAVVAGAGLDYALNYIGHRDRARAFSVFSTALCLALASAAVVTVLLAANVGGVRSFVYRGVPEVYEAAEVVSLGIVPMEVAFILTAMLPMTIGRPIVFGEMRLFRRSAVLLVVMLAVALHTSQLPAAILLILVGHVGAIGGASLFSLHRVRFGWSAPGGYVKSLVREGVRAYPGRLAERLQTRLGVVLLGILASGAAVGVYTVATAIAEVLFFVSSSAATVLFSRDITSDRELHGRVLRLMLPFAIVLAAAAGLAGTLLVPVVYGSKFVVSIELLWFLLPGVICLSLVHVLTPYLVQARLAHAVSVGHVLGLGSNVTINILLIPSIGAVGASIASSVSYALTLAVMVLWLARAENRTIYDIMLVRWSDYPEVRAALRRALFRAQRDRDDV